MYKKYPSLKDILNGIDSVDKVIKWAEENGMSDHPVVRERLNQFSVNNIINTITDPDVLTEWAIDNRILHHDVVLQRRNELLTCHKCNLSFDSSTELKEHTHRLCETSEKSTSPLDLRSFHETSDVNTDNPLDLRISRRRETVLYQRTDQYAQSTNDHHLHLNSEVNTSSPLDLRLSKIETRSITFADNTVKKEPEDVKGNFIPYVRSNDSGNRLKYIQHGKGADDILPYTLQQTNQKTFAKNKAKETTN